MMLANYIGYRSGVSGREACYCEKSGMGDKRVVHFLNMGVTRVQSNSRCSYPRRHDVVFWSYTQRAEDRE
jgi:hypothetical protein